MHSVTTDLQCTVFVSACNRCVILLQVIIIGGNTSGTSLLSPILKSPGIVESIKALTDVVQGLKTAVERMDKRLEVLEATVKLQVS